MGASIWTKKDEFIRYRKNIQLFKPSNVDDTKNDRDNEINKDYNQLANYESNAIRWHDAIRRLMNWYKTK
jgi:hypothetical protein